MDIHLSPPRCHAASPPHSTTCRAAEYQPGRPGGQGRFPSGKPRCLQDFRIAVDYPQPTFRSQSRTVIQRTKATGAHEPLRLADSRKCANFADCMDALRQRIVKMFKLAALGCLVMAISVAHGQEPFSRRISPGGPPAGAARFDDRGTHQSTTRPVLDDRHFDPLRSTAKGRANDPSPSNHAGPTRMRPAIRLATGRVAETTDAGPQLAPADGGASPRRPAPRTSAENRRASGEAAPTSRPRPRSAAASPRATPREPRPLKIARQPQRSLPSGGADGRQAPPRTSGGRNVFEDSPILGYARDVHLSPVPRTTPPAAPAGGMNSSRRRALGW